MPLPTPNKGEDKDKFISRCMSNGVMKKEFPEQEQRVAVCHSQWRKKGESVKRDEDGKIIVAENVPLIFGASIHPTGEKDGKITG
jgi:hypothetical protein